MQTYSSVTVVYEPELGMLRAQAHSMSRYWKCTGQILVIVNDSLEVQDQIDKSWWGELADRVQVINYTHWLNDLPVTGWVSQQILKILGSAYNTSTWNIVLDAKSLFVDEIHDGKFLTDDGKVRTTHQLQSVHPVFKPSKDIIDQLFNIDLTYVAGPGGIPHWIRSDEANAMINDIEQLTSMSLVEYWVDNAMLTEFMLYSGYLQYKYGSIDVYYADEPSFGVVQMAHNEFGIFDSKFSQMQKDNMLTVCIHRVAWDNLTNEQKLKFNDYLLSRDLISYDHS